MIDASALDVEDVEAGPGLPLTFFVSVLVASAGLLAIAVAFNRSRTAEPNAAFLFWLGLGLLVASPVYRIIATTSRLERVVTLLLLTALLYAVKVLRDPNAFAFHDEFIHWRTAEDILSKGPFADNPLLFISPFYPGLEMVTVALSSVAGVSIFTAGVCVVFAAKILVVLSLFAFYRRISSERTAGIAALVYLTNPGFIFFDSQFSYESLSLAIGALVLLVTMIWQDSSPNRALGPIVMLLTLALVLTHHLVSLVLLAFLGIWLVASLVTNSPARRILIATLLLAGIGAVWTLTFARETLAYLAPIFESPVSDLVGVITGKSAVRGAFQSYSGEEATVYERMMSLGSLLVIWFSILAGVLLSLKAIRQRALQLSLALCALAVPLTLPLRFVSTGGEIADRATHSLYVAAGLVVAIFVVWLLKRFRHTVPVHALVAAGFVLLVFGGAQLGSGPTARILPSTYHVGADSQSVEEKGINLAEWTLKTLGPDNRFTADRTNNLLLATYGRQQTSLRTQGHEGDILAPIFMSQNFGSAERRLLVSSRVRFLAVDSRLSKALPVFGLFFENGEPDSFNHKTPLSARALAKFDQLPRVDKLYDSGDLSVYDMRDYSADARPR